jgi:hypothetical protein
MTHNSGREISQDVEALKVATFAFEENEQPPVVLEKSCGEIADLPVGTLQMPARPRTKIDSWTGSSAAAVGADQLAAAKLVPLPE